MNPEILNPRLHLVAVLAACGLLIVITMLVRRARLSAGIALPWLAAGFTALGFAAFPSALAAVARALGIGLPVNALFFLALLVVAVLLLALTILASRSAERETRLAQKIALLESRVERLTSQKKSPHEN